MPKFILLDEPNSNLDQDGDLALAKVLFRLRELGSTVILVTHRSNLLQQVDQIAFMRDGQLAAFGPRDDVLKALQPQVAVPSGSNYSSQMGSSQ